MTRQESESGLWIAVGGIGAIVLGVVLIPLRASTAASNLAFAFLILTLVIAEVGGRTAGLVTAVISALSLNFFLTEPYLTLTIDKPEDVVAFAALAVSGLIAAAFGRRRVRSSELVTGVRHDLEALGRAAGGLTAGAALETVLEDLRRSFRLGGLVVRADDRLVAAVPPEYGERWAPALELEPRTLLATDERWHRLGSRGFRLPEGGGRLPLRAHGEPVWLDLWEGDPDGLSLDECRALAVAIAMLGLTFRPAVAPRAS
jgi:Domain of unknown function (DUF4118)